MTTMTQLFKIVTTNDFDSLEKLVYSNKKPDFNCVKSGQSLITKAIEVRAFECFNLLMGLSDLNIFKNSNSNINGLGIAIEYYISAPNNSNAYYLEKLLEKNVAIDVYATCKCIGQPVLFEKLFSRMEKTSTNIKSLIYHTLRVSNYQLFVKLFEFIQNNNLGFYNTPNNKLLYNLSILKNAIEHNNIQAIEYLESCGINIYFVSSDDFNNTPYPSIYYSIYTHNQISFNYFYSKMEKMTLAQLNAIPKIKNIEKLFNSQEFYKTTKKEFIELVDKLFKLPIEWEDIHIAIANLYHRIYRDNMYFYDKKKSWEQIVYEQNLIYMLLKTNKVKINPYDQIKSFKSNLNQTIQYNNNRLNPMVLENFKMAMRKCKYLLNSFGFNEPTELADHFKLIFPNDISTYENEKNQYLNDIKKINTNGAEEKTKAKTTRKKKQVVDEIDV